MRRLKLAIPLSILAAGLMMSTGVSFGRPEDTKKEKKPCTVCHVSAKSKELNETGKCYQKTKSLEGCEAKK